MLLMYQFIIMLSPIYHHFIFDPIDWTVLEFLVNNLFSKLINYFLVINSLLLKIKYNSLRQPNHYVSLFIAM